MFYTLLGPAMGLSGWMYRQLSAPRSGIAKVHLGPGRKAYLEGWINLDANFITARCDVWCDLRRPLPFRNATLDAVYSHHVIEHLPDLPGHFREVFRCLKPGAVYRTGGPNGDAAIAGFIAGDKAWFSDFPDRFSDTGARFDNYLMCRGEHLHILTFSLLAELLADAGFEPPIQRLPVKETGYPKLFAECLATEWESDFECPHTLIVEARKPATIPSAC